MQTSVRIGGKKMTEKSDSTSNLIVLKESVTAALGVVIILATLVLMWPSLSGSTLNLTNAQGIFAILGGWGGVILGYYFGRLPSEKAADTATKVADQANQTTKAANQISNQAQEQSKTAQQQTATANEATKIAQEQANAAQKQMTEASEAAGAAKLQLADANQTKSQVIANCTLLLEDTSNSLKQLNASAIELKTKKGSSSVAVESVDSATAGIEAQIQKIDAALKNLREMS